MPDSAASSCRGVAPLQRRESLKNMGRCMGILSQIFHLNRMLGGSNKFLATPDARDPTSGTKNEDSILVEKHNSLRKDRTHNAEMGIDLRKILDAKQEPLDLQDVIWEKMHPVRTRSSRELKFEVTDTESSQKKSQRSKRAKSKESRQHADENSPNVMSGSPKKSGVGSSGLVKGNRSPAESMVALPSSQASQHMRKMCSSSSSSKSASSKSPVKSPNKRALLMEAAARILEGSNRRGSKIPSSSVRSLLRELDGSKHSQVMRKTKEVSLRKAASRVESTAKRKWLPQKVATPEQRLSEHKQFSCSSVGQSFSFLRQFQQTRLTSLDDGFEMTDEEVLMIMQSRLHPSGEMSTPAEEFCPVAAVTTDKYDAMQQGNHLKVPDNYFSRVDTTEETVSSMVHVAAEGKEGSTLISTGEHVHQAVECVMASKIVHRNHSQLGEVVMVEKSRDLVIVTSDDSRNTDPICELHEQEFVDSSEHNTSPQHSRGGNLSGSCKSSISQEVPIEGSGCVVDASKSGSCEIGVGHPDVAHAYGVSRLDVHPIIFDEMVAPAEMGSEEVETIKNAPRPVLLLCNYSWWTHNDVQADLTASDKDKTSSDCAGYESPIAATKGPCAVKIFEENKEGGNLEEDSSASPDHSYAEEFQQSSPVSVLDLVYEDAAVLCKPFDYFDEARQKLLESVRRYEMLANMDLDMLIKVNEESLCHEFDEESDASSFKGSWESDVANMGATQHQASPMGSPDYHLPRFEGGLWTTKTEVLCSDAACGLVENNSAEGDSYSHLGDDLYMQQWQELANKDVRNTSDFLMDVRARFKVEEESRRWKTLCDYPNEPLDSQAIKGSNKQVSSRGYVPTNASGDEEKLTDSAVIDTMLHMDLTKNNWSSFNEESQAMEMELEGYLFAVMMQELLSDLLH